MKKFFEKFLWWFYSAMGVLFFILLSWIAYWAYVSMSDVTTGQPLTASTFNQVLENIRVLKTTVDWIGSWVNPPWAVIAFNLSSCPSWWIPANGTSWTPDLRWEFIRWLDSGRWVDSGRTLASLQSDSIKNHRHYATPASNNSVIGNTPDYGNTLMNLDVQSTIRTTWDMVNGWTETRPRNVALLYCVKQ